ncbi:hypothetical protein Tco_1359949 [Tanacetum coccineum]
MAGVDINTLTMEQYLALSRDNQAPGVVKPEIEGNVNFEIKSQFMRELREDTFSGNKDEDAHDHIDRLQKDGWTDSPQELSTLGISSKRPLFKGTYPGMRPAEALTAIQTMADHSQKWHDGTTSRKIGSSNSSDGLAALVNKLDNLGRDMKKLKESVHAIQVGCQICEGPHLDKDCPLNEELKQIEKVRYGEFRRTMPFNGSNGGKFRVGPPGYYTKIDNRPPYGEKRQSLEELLAKHQEESARRSTEIEIEQLTKEIRSNKALEQVKTITADQETSWLDKLNGVSFISDPKNKTAEVLQHQLPRKELNPGNFTLPCTIGIDERRISFKSMRNNNMHTNLSERIFMVRPQSPAQSNNQINYEESGNWDNRSPNLGDREPKKRKIELDKNVPKAHFCNPIKQNIKEQIKMWPSYNPDKKLCDGEGEIYGVSKTGNLRFWYCSYDSERRNIKGKGLSFPDFLLAKYGKSQTDTLIWDSRYAEWCDISPSSEASSQELSNPRPRDYTFREWTLIKVGHTDISEHVKMALLKLWLIDCFQDKSAYEKNPTHRNFNDYKWEFNLEIDKLADV